MVEVFLHGHLSRLHLHPLLHGLILDHVTIRRGPKQRWARRAGTRVSDRNGQRLPHTTAATTTTTAPSLHISTPLFFKDGVSLCFGGACIVDSSVCRRFGSKIHRWWLLPALPFHFILLLPLKS
jgi:hypothetical protein